jgi:hypothetical protein
MQRAARQLRTVTACTGNSEQQQQLTNNSRPVYGQQSELGERSELYMCVHAGHELQYCSVKTWRVRHVSPQGVRQQNAGATTVSTHNNVRADKVDYINCLILSLSLLYIDDI